MEYPIYEFSRSQLTAEYNEIWNAPDPPNQLYVQGNKKALSLLDQLPERGLAIVGTRNPQALSVGYLQKKIFELSDSKLIIISGLARGIDTTAHRSALQANLPTLAILGTGLDSNYPQENRDLRQQILHSNGLIISEYPRGTPALPHHFLRRNRLIASWSKATWIVEASHRSGALNTARWAREMDRTCLTLPCFPGNPAFAGNQSLLDQDRALPFWGIHSLGAAWIEFATFFKKDKNPKGPFSEMNSLSTAALELAREVNRLSFLKGGAQVQELLDDALSKKWEPETFFSALQAAIQKKLIIDQQGTLISRNSQEESP